jgi:hypothetical protein
MRSESAHSLDIAQTRALLLPVESQPNSTEIDVEIRSASRDENLSRQEEHQMVSNLEIRKSEKLLASVRPKFAIGFATDIGFCC